MKIGIIGAMQMEVDNLKEAMENQSTVTVSGIRFVSGTIGEMDVVAAVCGVGKVFAAICAEAMILKFNPDMIINIGVAGTLTKDLGVLDVAVASDVLQHDMDTSAVGDPVGLISGINMIQLPADQRLCQMAAQAAEDLGINCKLGVIASGDQFVADRDRKNFIHDTFGAIACEMEGASIGHVCYINNVPFVVLRAISDDVAGNGPEDYPKFKMKAAKISNEMTCRLVQRYGKGEN